MMLSVIGACCFHAQAVTNLIPDASFEAPIAPAWNSVPANSTFVETESVTGAVEGKSVLVIQGWDRAGSRVLSMPVSVPAEKICATVNVRGIKTGNGVEVELALFDELGTTKIASIGKASLADAGGWMRLVGAVNLPNVQRCRLGVIVSGPQRGARVELDAAGLFEGETPGAVSDNASWDWFEAESLADGAGWKMEEHYVGWYSDLPSDGKMLSGFQGVPAEQNRPAVKTLKVRFPGVHRLWVRFVNPHPTHQGVFTVGLQQNGKTVAEKVITDNDKQFGEPFTWVWAAIDAELSAGEVQVVLSRPSEETSYLTRKIDLFALTNLLDHKPQKDDFQSRGFVRFINKSAGVEPFTWWMFVRRHQGPLWYATPGILSASGFSENYTVPDDKEQWLWPGEASPWVDIQKYLLPASGRNNVQMLATRLRHTTGFVRERIQGTFEFSVGPERRVIKAIEIDQAAPRVLLTLPDGLQKNVARILSPFDYIKKSEAALDKIQAPPGRVAQHLDLSAMVALDGDLDNPEVIQREINILKRLGFNNLYSPIAAKNDQAAFNARNALSTKTGAATSYFNYIIEGCQNQPDLAKMREALKEEASRLEPVLNQVVRIKIADEPGAMSYEHIVGHQHCRQQFVSYLKKLKVTPEQLGVKTWEQVVPVLPSDSKAQPFLFYHTAMFRLHSFAELARICNGLKNEVFPAATKSYINYIPPHSEYVDWVRYGSDPFMAQRQGGLEMGWSEDWMAYGASPQQISDSMAMLRAAGSPAGSEATQPLGGYMVAMSWGPILQRLKYYGMVAGGARQVNVYNYGPHYAGIDDWSTRHELFPTLSAVQHELGVIDNALQETTRQKSDVAILYNRTSGIWAERVGSSQQDTRVMRWALSHAGYDADFIAEEDVVEGKLDRYKALYLSGIHIRSDAAQGISDWVKGGGVLFGDAGAATRDEYNRPLMILETVFGARSQNLQLEADSGRPKYELRSLQAISKLSTLDGTGAPKVSFDQLSYRESLAAEPTATIVLKNDKGETTGVINTFGQGKAIRVAAMPGIAYLHEAVQGKDYDIEAYLPKNYSAQLRDFIAWPATLAKAFRTAQARSGITEIVRYNGKNRAVFFVLDHNAMPDPNFQMVLPAANQWKKAYSASGNPVTLKALEGGQVQVSFALNVSDAIVLE